MRQKRKQGLSNTKCFYIWYESHYPNNNSFELQFITFGITWFTRYTRFTWQWLQSTWRQLYIIADGSAAIDVAFFPRFFSSVLHTEIFSGSIIKNLLLFLFVLCIFLHIPWFYWPWSAADPSVLSNTLSTGLFEEDIVIAISVNKQIFENSLHQYTNIFSHISWYSRCMDDALIFGWSERHLVDTFRSLKPTACKDW